MWRDQSTRTHALVFQSHRGKASIGHASVEKMAGASIKLAVRCQPCGRGLLVLCQRALLFATLAPASPWRLAYYPPPHVAPFPPRHRLSLIQRRQDVRDRPHVDLGHANFELVRTWFGCELVSREINPVDTFPPPYKRIRKCRASPKSGEDVSSDEIRCTQIKWHRSI
jgi:hypothetical protein